MPKKVINFILELEVHAVTCPGVWLCPDGNVSLKIQLFKEMAETECLAPVFPILYHKKFIFQKLFPEVHFLMDLQKALQKEILRAELLQWPRSGSQILLSTFRTTLLDLLCPSGCRRTGDIDLLMEPSNSFPGILSPKIETSTRITVDEVIGSFTETEIENAVTSKLLNSTKYDLQGGVQHDAREPLKRQRRVCHSLSQHEKEGNSIVMMGHAKHLRNERQNPFSIRNIHTTQLKNMNQTHQKIEKKIRKYDTRQNSPLLQWTSVSNGGRDSLGWSGLSNHHTKQEQVELDSNGLVIDVGSHYSQSCIVCSQYKSYFENVHCQCSETSLPETGVQ